IILYDETGLHLFDDVTTRAPEYYLFSAENGILERCAGDIVRVMNWENMRGTYKSQQPVMYYALDLEKIELLKTLKQLTRGYQSSDTRENGPQLSRIGVGGLWGTYEDGIRFITSTGLQSVSSVTTTRTSNFPPIHYLFLGSSLGNFTPPIAADFLRRLPLRPGSDDTLLLGLDGNTDNESVTKAYGDKTGHVEAFNMHGLKVAGRILGDEELFPMHKWK
ncbi:hypothetical protein M422DRAFT_87551, partial [Sphaerobolus stellatus SS14]